MKEPNSLGTLPHRAIVAYLVRCARLARRAYPNDPHWPHAIKRDALDRCINAATLLCFGARKIDNRPIDLAAKAAKIAEAAAAEARRRGDQSKAERLDAAAYAAHAAMGALASALSRDIDTAAGFGQTTEAATAKAVGDELFEHFSVNDLKKLRSVASSALDWTIDPSDKGPLGPLPKRGPSGAYNEIAEPPIELYLDVGSASMESLTEVLTALNELHRAAGGFGFRFNSDGTFVSAYTEAFV